MTSQNIHKLLVSRYNQQTEKWDISAYCFAFFVKINYMHIELFVMSHFTKWPLKQAVNLGGTPSVGLNTAYNLSS